MKEADIVIIDGDADYCRRLDGALRARLSLPVRVHDYTQPEALASYENRQQTAAVLIAEREICRTDLSGFPRVVVLSEGMQVPLEAETVRRVNKYGGVNTVIRVINELVSEMPDLFEVLRDPEKERAKLIGFFSPLGRCLQTTAALTCGQLLAQQRRVLFLSLEPFCGHPVTGENGGGDLSELLYYHELEPEKLAFHAARAKISVGSLDVIPPPGVYTAITETEGERWREFFLRLAADAGYEVILADLSVWVRGLFELMREMDLLYRICRGDPVSAAKERQYELTLKRTGFEDLSVCTKRLELPVFSRLPADPAHYGTGELAGYMRQELMQDGLLGGGER